MDVLVEPSFIVFISLPELDDRDCSEYSSEAPARHSCSLMVEGDRVPDDDTIPKLKKVAPSSLFKSIPSSDSFEPLVLKYGHSNTISGCWLKKLRRGSQRMSFSKCLFNKPCEHCRKCFLQEYTEIESMLKKTQIVRLSNRNESGTCVCLLLHQ